MNRIEQQKAYWLRQLASPPPAPRLPWAKEAPPVSCYVRENVATQLTPKLWQGIKQLAARTGTSPQVVLLAALKLLVFRYTGQTDLITGTVLRTDSNPAGNQLVALRTRAGPDLPVSDWLRQVAGAVREAARHLELPFDAVVRLLEETKSAEALFNVAMIYVEPECVPSNPPRCAESPHAQHLMSCGIVLSAWEAHESAALSCEYDAEILDRESVGRLAGHFETLLASMVAEPNSAIGRLNLITAAEQQQLLTEWNATATALPRGTCLHQFIEAQAQKTPDAVAVVCAEQELTYAQLNARANQLAAYLCKLGVRPESLVGLCCERSLDMLIGLVGILKSGGAYLPLDPAYPLERLAYMMKDAKVEVVLTQAHLSASLPPNDACVLRLDADWPLISAEPAATVDRGVGPHHLAYVIYTSGSTGTPKGVMVEHGNVLNFFAGMDQRIPYAPGSTWLAVTSPSFDISVLELFWTLARGFKVVLYTGQDSKPAAAGPARTTAPRPIELSLFYFSSAPGQRRDGNYRLLTEGARFADEHGFVAVWTPERHFHEFGGLYPNPSITSAALSMITRRVQIRAGSVVAPLHSPLRIAEEWSVVDNLSNGRVAISFASGWNPDDFALNPANYAGRKEVMLRQIDEVRRLWRGERIAVPGPLGKEVQVKIFPPPVQAELPLWLTAAGNPETFQTAGRLGANLLTHLLGQSIEEVSEKIALYRQAWKEAGHSGRGHVALMLHTFVGESLDSVRAAVRQPLIEYLRQSADLIKGYAWAFSAFKPLPKSGEQIDFSALSAEEMDALLAHAFDRYFETSGLFGTPEACLQIVKKLQAKDVDEIACLIDFGVDETIVLDHLKHLAAVRKEANSGFEQSKEGSDDYSIPALVGRHKVTHLQCTPSLAGMLLLDGRGGETFGRLRVLMLGGEALPPKLAQQLQPLVEGDILNMYGPTETTVWSSTYALAPQEECISIGRPIANTSFYIVDQNLLPVPAGVVGELMIGGAGVARGYLDRPELTSQRFIPNPFASANNQRLYRTGDLARYLPNGNVELLGRMDQQVKIRGHRVELGEIEALLSAHPMVRDSVVVARADPNADNQLVLVAYIIPREPAPTREQLRKYAQEKMPPHQVPARFVFLTHFPQTPNQKIDRQALPAPGEESAPDQGSFEPPLSEVEQTVAGLWKELLGVQRIGRQDNFFEAGGHSLLAMQFVGRVRDRFGVALPLKNLFERPTVAGLAEIIDALMWTDTAKTEVAPTGAREEIQL